MFADNGSTAMAQVADASSRLIDDAPMEHLREIARRHQVCYEVWPEWSVAEERKIQIGFELQLCGTNPHDSGDGSDHPVPGCAHCVGTYGELRQIAEWILPREERPSRYEIGAFDHSLHIAPPKRRRRNEVLVSIHIMHRHDFNRAVDECENRCLKEMQQRLRELGIVEGMWHEPVDVEVSDEGRKEMR
jgi:hypothetical protein